MSGCAFREMKKLKAKLPLGARVKAKIARQSCSSRCSCTCWLAKSFARKSYVVDHCAAHLGVMLKLICDWSDVSAGCRKIWEPLTSDCSPGSAPRTSVDRKKFTG